MTVVLTSDENQATKYLAKSTLIDAKQIDESLMMICIKTKRSLVLNYFLIGYDILQASKLK